MSNKTWFVVVTGVVVLVAAFSLVLREIGSTLSGHARAPDARAPESENVAADRQRVQGQRTKMASIATERRTAREPAAEVAAAPSSEPEAVRSAAREDRSEVLAASLDADYTVDAPPTQESFRKESALKTLFAGLNGAGQLQEVACRERVCRGVVRIANEAADDEVFTRTFLSNDFVKNIQDAVSVTSRQKQPDGSVLATFFIHPQSAFDVVAKAPSGSGE